MFRAVREHVRYRVGGVKKFTTTTCLGYLALSTDPSTRPSPAFQDTPAIERSIHSGTEYALAVDRRCRAELMAADDSRHAMNFVEAIDDARRCYMMSVQSSAKHSARMTGFSWGHTENPTTVSSHVNPI